MKPHRPKEKARVDVGASASLTPCVTPYVTTGLDGRSIWEARHVLSAVPIPEVPGLLKSASGRPVD